MEKFYTAQKKLSQLRKQASFDLSQKHMAALKYLSKKKLLPSGLRQRSQNFLASATLAGSLLLSQGKAFGVPNLLEKPAEERVKKGIVTSEEIQKLLAQRLGSFVPQNIGKLTEEEGKEICQTIKDILGVDVCTELEGFKLNYDYAWTGYEQHLFRYPGDDLNQHDEELIAGIAPGLGAWGYFSESKDAITEEDKLKEKYYVVVQTLYFDDWDSRSEEIYNFFKHRKMIMINPENGQACVAVIGDAGPAQWTGKQFGACPEVMKALNLHEEMRKGKVLLMFVDDPEGKVPLGPIDFNLEQGKPEIA
ncbi:MAG TPA: hypothetical protein VMW29_04115 [Candidatus Bathyarchaeia archaeon]|nr:hypothetical protein [Candidatus Bathyarchaeia archaeon]